MSQAIQIDMASLHVQMQRLAFVTHKTTEEVIANQAGLLLRDSIRFTPPHGNAPITEALSVQKDIGEKRVKRDIKKVIYGMRRVELEDKIGEIESAGVHGALARLWVTKDGKVYGTERELLRPDASWPQMRAHHAKYRTKWGRVTQAGTRTRDIGRWKFVDKMVVGVDVFHSYIHQRQSWVGNAKAGWLKALDDINKRRRTPITLSGGKWITRHKGRATGLFFDYSNNGKIDWIMGNGVPYIQKHAGHIMDRAYQNRARNLAKEVRIAERHYVNALRKAGL